MHIIDPMKYGYARVIQDGQSVDAQVRQLKAAGCKTVFREVASGAKTDRAQLRRLLGQLDDGDVLTVTRLDRLARSTRDLLNTLAAITAKKAGFRSLGDTWADTTTSHGRLMLTVLGGLAEFERDLIRSRTGEGRARAKAAYACVAQETRLHCSVPPESATVQARLTGSKLIDQPGKLGRADGNFEMPCDGGCRCQRMVERTGPQHQRVWRPGDAQHRGAAAGDRACRVDEAQSRSVDQIPQGGARITKGDQKGEARVNNLILQASDRLPTTCHQAKRTALDSGLRKLFEAVERGGLSVCELMLDEP
jgi:hypothetical protein